MSRSRRRAPTTRVSSSPCTVSPAASRSREADATTVSTPLLGVLARPSGSRWVWKEPWGEARDGALDRCVSEGAHRGSAGAPLRATSPRDRRVHRTRARRGRAGEGVEVPASQGFRRSDLRAPGRGGAGHRGLGRADGKGMRSAETSRVSVRPLPVLAARAFLRLRQGYGGQVRGGGRAFSTGARGARGDEIRAPDPRLFRPEGHGGRYRASGGVRGDRAAHEARRPGRRPRGHGRDDARQRPGRGREDLRRLAAPRRQPGRPGAAAPRRVRLPRGRGRDAGVVKVRVFRVPSREARAHLQLLSRRSRSLFDGEASETAARALAEIRRGADRALARWRRRFDGVTGPPRAARKTARVSMEFRLAFDEALRRLTAFHRLQKTPGAILRIAGSSIEEKIVPLDSVGVYIPGGEAPYVSTALMTILPARIAGVPRIAVATPPAAYDGSAELRYALERLRVTEVYRMGGAHAIAALAVGTPSVPRVAKIVGPGNRFVTAAKRLVSGLVGIDGLAGPTEVAVYADASADPERVAADLLAQAEHDVEAAALLVTTSSRLAERVAAALARRLA